MSYRRRSTPRRNAGSGLRPVDLFSARGHLRGTAESNRRFMAQQMRMMRRRSEVQRRRSSRAAAAAPERVIKYVPTTIKCKDKDKEGANEYAHHESATRISKPIGLKELNDLLAPQWTEKVYHAAHNKMTYTANTELVLEFCLMDKNMVFDRLRKVVEISPFEALMQNAAIVGNSVQPAVPSGAVTNAYNLPSSAAQYMVKMEGGKYTYTFMNTCSNTIHFEFRQYKLAPESLKVGAKLSTRSPLKCFQTDQLNTWETGDLPFAHPFNPANSLTPANTDRLANWTIYNATELAGAESNPTANLLSHGLVCNAVIPAFKRPNRSSPLLHGIYNQIAILKIKLKPGDTFVYDIRINPFTTSGVQGQNLPTDHLMQYYSRILQVYARSEFNVDSAAGGNMSTGPGQFAIVSSHTLNWRAVPKFKTNNVIEQAITTATLGPYADITNANATAMEMQEPDPEAYNVVG